MYRLHLLLLAALAVCQGKEIEKTIEANSHHKLEPEDLTGTTWHMKTNKGAIIIINCELLIKDCKKASLKVGRRGGYMQEFCNSEVAELNNAVSNDHEISLRISSRSNDMPAYCNVSAPLPYLNAVDQDKTDSNEEGLPIDSKPTCRCGWTNKDRSRIVGGKETDVNEFPFVVALGLSEGRPFCGGSILTPYHILTAAHCFNASSPMEDYRIIVGAHNINPDKYNEHTKVLKVKKIYIHERYDTGKGGYDVAIFHLKEKIQFNDFVGPVCMPKAETNLKGEFIKVIGWGYNNWKLPDVLMSVHIKVVDNSICNVIFRDAFIKGTQLCTYSKGKDMCQGDSGGPLVKVNPKTNMLTQYGVVSYGFSCATNVPGVSSEVLPFMSWIKARIQESQKHELCY